MRKLVFLMTAGCVLSTSVCAQQIVYTPVNPSFGGSGFNSSYLLGTADAQNQFKNKTGSVAGSTDYTQQFIQMLETRIYSALAQKVSDTLFGSNCSASCSGEIALGDQKVSYLNDGTKMTLNISDASGKITTITIPTLMSSAN